MKRFKYVLLTLSVFALLATPLVISASHGGLGGGTIPPLPFQIGGSLLPHSHNIEYIAFFGIGLAVGILATFTLLSYRRDAAKRVKGV